MLVRGEFAYDEIVQPTGIIDDFSRFEEAAFYTLTATAFYRGALKALMIARRSFAGRRKVWKTHPPRQCFEGKLEFRTLSFDFNWIKTPRGKSRTWMIHFSTKAKYWADLPKFGQWKFYFDRLIKKLTVGIQIFKTIILYYFIFIYTFENR